MNNAPKERIDKVLSKHGYGSRKDVKKLLHTGTVLVNGQVCTAQDAKIDMEHDVLSVDGKIVSLVRHRYFMMNKVSGTVCSQKEGIYTSVYDLISEEDRQDALEGTLHLVGRLDVDTEGLLLLTTDGDLTHRLISPKSRVDKVYQVTLEKPFDEEMQKTVAAQFAAGILVPAEGREVAFTAENAVVTFADETHATLTIHEGKFHQVKRMFAAAGNKVVYLKRIAEGELQLDETIPPGSYRNLTAEELAVLGVGTV